MRERINNQIRASKLRVIDETNQNIGVLDFKEALELARERELDLIEISPNANPPVAKIMNFGKYQYETNKKQKQMKANATSTETKSIQIKVGTGDHDLQLKAKKTATWLKEGHRIKIELFLSGRLKYMDKDFLRGRLERMLHFITEDYKISSELKPCPKGLMIIIEKAK